jgi:hypothetical protein
MGLVGLTASTDWTQWKKRWDEACHAEFPDIDELAGRLHVLPRILHPHTTAAEEGLPFLFQLADGWDSQRYFVPDRPVHEISESERLDAARRASLAEKAMKVLSHYLLLGMDGRDKCAPAHWQWYFTRKTVVGAVKAFFAPYAGRSEPFALANPPGVRNVPSEAKDALGRACHSFVTRLTEFAWELPYLSNISGIGDIVPLFAGLQPWLVEVMCWIGQAGFFVDEGTRRYTQNPLSEESANVFKEIALRRGYIGHFSSVAQAVVDSRDPVTPRAYLTFEAMRTALPPLPPLKR